MKFRLNPLFDFLLVSGLPFKKGDGGKLFLYLGSQRVILALSALALTGCTITLDLSQSAEPVTEYERPESVALEDEFGNGLGFATALRPNVFVAPDHLWQTGGDLYYQNRPIEVLARDFRHDVLFFTVPKSAFAYNFKWSENPPGVGKSLSWHAELQQRDAPVYSAKAEWSLGQTEIEKLMSISMVTSPGDSGKALYDKETGLVYGMLMGTDSLKEISYFVRSDVILNLAAEYLD